MAYKRAGKSLSSTQLWIGFLLSRYYLVWWFAGVMVAAPLMLVVAFLLALIDPGPDGFWLALNREYWAASHGVSFSREAWKKERLYIDMERVLRWAERQDDPLWRAAVRMIEETGDWNAAAKVVALAARPDDPADGVFAEKSLKTQKSA